MTDMMRKGGNLSSTTIIDVANSLPISHRPVKVAMRDPKPILQAYASCEVPSFGAIFQVMCDCMLLKL